MYTHKIKANPINCVKYFTTAQVLWIYCNSKHEDVVG